MYERGAVVRGPDVFGGHSYRPWVTLTDRSHPFEDEEGLYAAVTTTRRSVAVPLAADDFVSGGLPRESYVNPWAITTIKDTDVDGVEGHLTDEATERIARAAAGYLGIES
ncbi:hypothetical protein RYH80_09960 [Halobaculum sp. MBLA0147]|uniref:hypothetical protein n=1 Tax=Halobaculum sp. MBLA0147 TaxID=3079934 RepID=UPI003526A62A